MNDDDKLLQKSMGSLRDRVADLGPEVRDILDRAKAGEISEEEAMGQLMGVFQENPSMTAKLMDATSSAMAPLQQQHPTLPPLGPGYALAGRGEEEAVIGGAEFFSGVGLPRLNPLYEAALLERAQFDGDIPEARINGLLPQDVKPAVSVLTSARNPVALGDMLEKASNAVEKEVREHDRKRIQQVAGDRNVLALIKKSSSELAEVDPEFFKALKGTAETDHPSYKRGQVPAPVEVRESTGSELVAMTPQQKREKAWKFLSTTQGRRSAVSTIASIVRDLLHITKSEVEVRAYSPTREVDVLALADWSLTLSGPRSTQSSFSVIDTAARVLAANLEGQVHEDLMYLEVTPLNMVDTRCVGWAARLVVDK